MKNSAPRTGLQTRTIDSKFEVREANGERRIEGYFAVFGAIYEIRPGETESIDPHAFDDCLSDDVRCLDNHHERLVLGRTAAGTLTLRVDGHGLWGSDLINQDDTEAMNTYARNKRGDVNQASFGFEILDEDVERRADGTVHWTVKKVKLYEVSICTFPAYVDTSITARKAHYDVLRRRTAEWKTEQKERLKKCSDS